jgi:hypothetical protein
MKTAWILCVLVGQHSCSGYELRGHVQAYETELLCNQEMSKQTREAMDAKYEVVKAQCQSVETMLVETAASK